MQGEGTCPMLQNEASKPSLKLWGEALLPIQKYFCPSPRLLHFKKKKNVFYGTHAVPVPWEQRLASKEAFILQVSDKR